MTLPESVSDLAGAACPLITVILIVALGINSIWSLHSGRRRARTTVWREKNGNRLFKACLRLALAAAVLMVVAAYISPDLGLEMFTDN